MVRKSLKYAIVAAALAMVAAQAAAQERITRIIVAFPAGGPVDFVARAIAEPLGRELHRNVIVENKPGGNGAVAAQYIAQGAADGSLLWLTSVGAVAINPVLYDKLAYDMREFAPVSLVVDNDELLVVKPDNPARDAADFVARAKASLAAGGDRVVRHRQHSAPRHGAARRRHARQPAARAVQGRGAGDHGRHERPGRRILRRCPGPDRPREGRQPARDRHRRAKAPSPVSRRADAGRAGTPRRGHQQLVRVVRLGEDAAGRNRRAQRRRPQDARDARRARQADRERRGAGAFLAGASSPRC